MDKIIVYLDDAAHALQQLAPMASGGTGATGGTGQSTLWILVACPPRITKYISRWVTHSARDNWRRKWSEEQFSALEPTLRARGGSVTTLVVRGRLVDQTDLLLAAHPTARVLDARRPRLGQDMEPVTRNQPVRRDSRWSVPGAMAGVGALLVLASD